MIPKEAYPTKAFMADILSAVYVELLTFLTPSILSRNCMKSACLLASVSVTLYDAECASGLSSPNAALAASGSS